MSFEELDKYIKQLTLKQQEAIYLINGKELKDYMIIKEKYRLYNYARKRLDKIIGLFEKNKKVIQQEEMS